MHIEKCDICGKNIKDNQKIVVGYKFAFATNDICLKCAKPVVSFLKKRKLIEIDKKK